jgi:hypothetical protein
MISISKTYWIGNQRNNAQFPSAENSGFYELFSSNQYSSIFQPNDAYKMSFES